MQGLDGNSGSTTVWEMSIKEDLKRSNLPVKMKIPFLGIMFWNAKL